MIGKENRREPFCSSDQAFTLIEVMMSVGVIGLMLVSLYAGFSIGFARIQITREDERAAEILPDQMEAVRLLSWDQLVDFPGYAPTSFTAAYSVANPTNVPVASLIYSETVLLTNAPVAEGYNSDLRPIQIPLTWQSAQVTQRRTMTTFAS